MHFSRTLRDGARPEVVRNNMGHANICVTQNVCGKWWWEERFARRRQFGVAPLVSGFRRVLSTSFRNQMDAGSWDRRRG